MTLASTIFNDLLLQEKQKTSQNGVGSNPFFWTNSMQGEVGRGKGRKGEEGKEEEAWIVSLCTIQTQLSQAKPTPSVLSQAMSPNLAKQSWAKQSCAILSHELWQARPFDAIGHAKPGGSCDGRITCLFFLYNLKSLKLITGLKMQIQINDGNLN